MICHAPEAAPFPVFPLALAMIAPNLRVLLVAAIGPPPLLAPPPAAALIPAVDLPPVAGTADVKHRPATQARQNTCRHITFLAMLTNEALPRWRGPGTNETGCRLGNRRQAVVAPDLSEAHGRMSHAA